MRHSIYSLNKVLCEGRIGERITVLYNEILEVRCDLLGFVLAHTGRVSTEVIACPFRWSFAAGSNAIERTIQRAKHAEK